MRINEQDLANVSAGAQIVETKDGQWVVLPDDAVTFENKEQAIGAQKAIEAFRKKKENCHNFHKKCTCEPCTGNCEPSCEVGHCGPRPVV